VGTPHGTSGRLTDAEVSVAIARCHAAQPDTPNDDLP